jgi:hypothetical protein
MYLITPHPPEIRDIVQFFDTIYTSWIFIATHILDHINKVVNG